MDIGLDRKPIKGKPGVHVYFYASQNPKVYTIEPHEFDGALSAEKLCIKMFMDDNFKFDEKEQCNGSTEHAAIFPGSMHLFQLWDCDTKQYKAPNDEISLTSVVTSREFVLRIRFKYPPSLEKQNFSDIWESGAFYYYFLQCRHDFIHDILHDIYHCHVKEDLCIGLALVDMARLAFEKMYTLRQLKDKYEYHAFLPRHVAKKTKNPIVKWQLNKTSDSALEETYDNFYRIAKNPHRHSIVSYLKQLLPSVPEYCNEEFTIRNHPSKCDKLVVHPYGQKPPSIFLDQGKNSLETVGRFSSLTAIDVRECNVLLHFTDSKPQHLEFVDMHQARSFVAMLDGYYRLMFDYHYLLSNQVHSPIVKLWNELKCYGPLSKDYLKVIWRRNAGSVVEGSFLIKQRSSSFTDYVLIVHKMGRNYPAIRIIYNGATKTYSCDTETMRQLFQSHHREMTFSSVRELIRYYRSGDFKHLKLTSQLSPVPREDIPLMVCKDRHVQKTDTNATASLDLQNMESPALLSPYDVQLGKSVHVSLMFDLMEGTYGKEKVLIKQVKSNVQNRELLTLYFQSDVQKVMKWNHINIVRVYGICLAPFYVMSQRMWEGRLDTLLKKKVSSFKLHHCIQATGQLAQALMYLESHAFTHGAIRCKCILVTSFDSHGDIEVKLSGDMMAAYMSSLPLTDKLNVERLPWIALERWTSLSNETTESDVYSFGMTIWEICSKGERPLAHLSSDQVRIFIESPREIPVPSIIEAYKSAMHQYKDQVTEAKYNTLMSVVYQRIILHNISADPSRRMKPQDIVREMILLNCQFTPDAYDPIGKVVESSQRSGSGSNVTNGLDRHVRVSNNSGDSLSDRPLPSIPLPSPPSQAHIIAPSDLIGFEDGTAAKLGQGFYGEVYLCKLRQGNGKPPIKCAVKKLINKDREGEAQEAQLKEFERELKLMVPLAHKNIVRMYGECFYTFNDGQESRMIVMEYIRCGSLSMFVKDKGKLIPLDERHQLYKRFCMDIAEGMIFLHNVSDGVSIIHRDLAARNVLITSKPHTAKITDFGLARTLSEKDYYRCSQSSILPFLWCAPESMSSEKFTKASDVWSYAVVIWEMFSEGQRPYIKSVQTKVRDDGTVEVDLKSLIEVLSSSAPNSRLPKLPELSPDMYNLMMKCWQTDPSKRPTFESIRSQLQTII